VKGPIGVIGAGSWGTALAILIARKGLEVRLWGRNDERMATIQRDRVNARYLPDSRFPNSLIATSNLEETVTKAELLLMVIPSTAHRETLKKVSQYIKPETGILLAGKGFEKDTFKLMHQVAQEELGQDRKIAVVSGPTFAKEVAAGLPTATTIASENHKFAAELAELLHSDTFRAYTSEDITGVEIGGAVKNVLAIAAGIADGLNFGANTRAALITRGLVEIQRLGTALGADSKTFIGLAGLGDLVLTCTDNQSRNRRMGIGLAEGKSIDQIKQELGQVAEGVYAAKEVHLLAKKLNIEMPIVEHVYRIIYKNEDPQQAVHALLARDLKSE
jgi:glycerol-3-phosphate dehydrogenase (NAD(P)+)